MTRAHVAPLWRAECRACGYHGMVRYDPLTAEADGTNHLCTAPSGVYCAECGVELERGVDDCDRCTGGPS